MQPYFLPYVGYFQLIAASDMFIVYDNIEYTKKGWINRNRMLQNGTDVKFSIPLQNAPDTLDVCQRELAADFNRDRMINQFRGAYGKAPFFRQTMPLIEQLVRFNERNLFRFLDHSIKVLCAHLGIDTDIKVSSTVPIDHQLKGQEKVLALCKATGADCYVNAIGGLELYSKDEFQSQGIELKFIKAKPFEYPQFGNPFVPWLSIVDVLMFNDLESVRSCIFSNYEFV